MTLQRCIQNLVKNFRGSFFSLVQNLPKFPVIKLNFQRKESKDQFLLKCLKQKINARPLKLWMQLKAHGIPETRTEDPKGDHITADSKDDPVNEEPKEDLITEDLKDDPREDPITGGPNRNSIYGDAKEGPREDPINEDPKEHLIKH